MNVIKAIENKIESKLSLIEYTKQEIKQLSNFKEKSIFYLEELIQIGILPVKEMEVKVDYKILINTAKNTISNYNKDTDNKQSGIYGNSKVNEEEWLKSVERKWKNISAVKLGDYRTVQFGQSKKYGNGRCLHLYQGYNLPLLYLPLSCLYITTKET
jgi:hypothetical protein